MSTGEILRRKHNLAKTKIESQRGAMQAVLTRLDAAQDALVPPGARVEEAEDLIKDAMEIIQEELGE